MNLLLSALNWLFDPANYVPGSQSPLPIQDRLLEHLTYTAIAIVIAALIALPLGFYIGHTGKGRQFVIAFTGSMRALPTLGLLFFLLMVFGYFLSYDKAPIVGATIAFVVLAIPSMLAGAYSGLESVDRQTIDAARANGMTEWQILTQVEIPLSLPLIVGGVRAAVLQVVATVTIASYAGLGGLGRIVTSGIGLNNYDQILGGALLVTALALILDGMFAIMQRATATKGTTDRNGRSTAPAAAYIQQNRYAHRRVNEGIILMSTVHRRIGRHLPRLVAAGTALALVTALAACSSTDPTAAAPPASGTAEAGKVVVGSFAFPESEILGEIYAQALAAKGVQVDTKFNIGPRQQTIPALQDGSITLMPEYNGNLLAYYNPQYTERTTADVDAALTDAVAKDKLRVLTSAEAEDKDAYVVTKATADANQLTSIGDLSKIVPFTLGSNPQFGELGYGIPGLKDVYGVGTNAGDVTFLPIEDFGGPDTVKALVDDTVQVADIYTTSPALVENNLVVLDDPENHDLLAERDPADRRLGLHRPDRRDPEQHLGQADHRRSDRPARAGRRLGKGVSHYRSDGLADSE